MKVVIAEPARGLAGELITASLSNPLEDPAASGKVRPVILVRRQDSQWLVMGLTTKSTYRDGKARTPVPNPSQVGLNGPGFLWGQRLTRISVLDLDRHLGWVDAELAAAVILQARLSPPDAAALVAGAAWAGS